MKKFLLVLVLGFFTHTLALEFYDYLSISVFNECLEKNADPKDMEGSIGSTYACMNRNVYLNLMFYMLRRPEWAKNHFWPDSNEPNG